MTIDELIQNVAQKYRVDPQMLSRLVHTESSGNPKAVSPKGAQGLMQLMPKTAKEMGVSDPFNPEQNVEGGTKYLAQLIDRYGGDVKLALAAYNAGPDKVDQYGDVPPFEETQKYVRDIMGSETENKKGVRTFEGTYQGKKLRIQVPAGMSTNKDSLTPLFAAEFNRQSSFGKEGKGIVKPVKGDPYGFGRETLGRVPSAIGRAFSPSTAVGGDFGTGFGGGDEVTPESLRRGMSGEDIPIIGNIIRGFKGETSPDEIADLLVGAGQAGVSGGLRSSIATPENAARLGNAIQGAREAPGLSKTGAALGSAAGGATGAGVARTLGVPYQVGLYPGMAAGAAMGGRALPMIRGFRQGLQEPYTIPAERPVYNPEYAPSPTAQSSMQPRLQNTVDARTQSPATPMPSATTPAQSAGLLPSPSRALPTSNVIQMPPARQVPIYGGKPGLAREPGQMYVPRQRTLPLYQEGANVPGEIPGFRTPPSETMSAEQAGQRLVPNIRREKMISEAKKVEQPQPKADVLETTKIPEKKPGELKEMPKKTGQVILPSAVKDYARVHGISETAAAKYFTDLGYEIRKRSLKK